MADMMVGALDSPSCSVDPGVDNRSRFVMELEFVQCLANPHYLNWLAQNRYFEDPAFLAYLQYLAYWRRPEYARYLRYPHSLFMLDTLESEAFRKAIVNTAVTEEVHSQQFWFWQHFRSNRAREGGPVDAAPTPVAVTDPESGAAASPPP